MIEALALEVAAIKKKHGGFNIPLRDGRRTGQAGEQWLYQFVVSGEVNLRDDTPVDLKIDGETVGGTLVSFRDNVLIVALEEDMGSEIARAQLTADDSFLVERLRERLADVRDGKASVNTAAANRALGLASIKTKQVSRTALTEDGRLNSEQLTALRQALGSDTTFVWGPPGTGKTTTLARIVEAHYRNGRSVLLVSNTNIAVDTALEQVADRLQGEADFQRGLVVRKGTVVKPELRERFGQYVIPRLIAERRGADLREEREALQDKLALLEAEEHTLRPLLDDLLRHKEAAAGLEERGREASLAAREAARLEADAAKAARQSTRLRAEADRVESMSALRRLATRTDPNRLRRGAEAADRRASANADAARTAHQRAAELESEADTLRVEVRKLAPLVEGQPPAENVQARLAAIKAELGQIRGRIAEIDAVLGRMEQEILQNARIVATTVYQTYLGPGLRQFDVVVIDEASMLMPPLTWHAAGLSRTSVTIAGDFRQLAPIVTSDRPLADEWLKRDAFQLAGIPAALEQGKTPSHLAPLTMQYRMTEPICDVVNGLFYQGRLKTDPSVNDARDAFPFGAYDDALFYIDTSTENPWAAFREGSRSRYNLLHALLIRNVVRHLGKKGYLPSGGPNDALGIVAPYGAQARLIQALISELSDVEHSGIAATVHRFQGNEKNTMIIDLVDSPGVPVGRFLKATALEDDGARLLNVALSRAKYRTILLGNFTHLQSKIKDGALLPPIISHFMEHGTEIPITKLLPITSDDWIHAMDHTHFPEIDFDEDAAGIFDETRFYPAFRKDIERAQSSVVIFSPFLSEKRIGSWEGIFRSAIKRGVIFHVFTKPPGATKALFDDPQTLVDALRSMGVTVSYRNSMHEKIAIIDGEILWHGSLNILSHGKALESMIRIVNLAFCRELIERLVGVQENSPCGNCNSSDSVVRMRQSATGGTFFKCLQCGKTFNP